jgi:hypothetical protein
MPDMDPQIQCVKTSDGVSIAYYAIDSEGVRVFEVRWREE